MLFPPWPSLFPTGSIYCTPGALEKLDPMCFLTHLQRHSLGDWGDLDQEDIEANNKALKEGTRLLSAYTAPNGIRFWIITEWDRSATAVLLPEEY